jgi:hypothetical protein
VLLMDPVEDPLVRTCRTCGDGTKAMGDPRRPRMSIPAARQAGAISSSRQHHLEMRTRPRIGGQSVRCQIHCETPTVLRPDRRGGQAGRPPRKRSSKLTYGGVIGAGVEQIDREPRQTDQPRSDGYQRLSMKVLESRGDVGQNLPAPEQHAKSKRLFLDGNQ